MMPIIHHIVWGFGCFVTKTERSHVILLPIMHGNFRRFLLSVCVPVLILDGGAILDLVLHPIEPDASFQSPFYRAITVLVPLLLTLLIGFFILRRVPGNIIGPFLILYTGTIAYNSMREGIGQIPFAIYYGYNVVFGWGAFFLMFIFFPDGNPYPRRAARWILPFLGPAMVMVFFSFLATETFDIPSRMANPFFIPEMERYGGPITIIALFIFIPFLVLALVSPILRYRKGNQLEKQQIKWLALFGGCTSFYSVLGLIIYPLLTGAPLMNPGYNVFAMFFYFFTGLFPALVIGISISRYRLWEIDRLISRTLVYTILSVLLTLIYFSSVVILQTVFSFFFQSTSNNLVTAISTIMIAFLFTPLRRRIQVSIDHRFFRQKYDADQILINFGRLVQEEVSIDSISNALIRDIDHTIQPERMSVWLRKNPE
jgi:hypothetical protein